MKKLSPKSYATGRTNLGSRVDLIQLGKRELAGALEAYSLLAESEDLLETLVELASVSAKAITSGGVVFFAGNGGSFADAQHMAAELTGKMARMRKPLPGIVLGANSSSMSAVGNDFGFEHVFSRELEALHQPESVVIGFTSSGNSKNLIELAKMSTSLGLAMFCFTGKSAGAIDSLCSTIKVPSERTERVQELQTTLGHLLCLLIEEELRIFPEALV